ncbi:MAG: hypothetical protein EOO77_08675 [Oxalobacteraceae bacterium]|nr:MAG: hypothetical protein EOO77_08675 [Oxalobacteraceae bacterium]
MKNAGRFVVVLLVVFAARFGIDEYRTRTLKFDDAVESIRKTQSDMADMFGTMHQLFPNEYAEFSKSMEAQARAGASREDVRLTAGNGMRQFMKIHLQELAQAPNANLRAFNQQQIAVAKALNEVDSTLCAHFVMTGLQPTDRPPESLLSELGKAGVIQLNAIAAGRKSPAGRKVDTISDADAAAMVEAIRGAGLTDSDLKIFGTPAKLAATTPGTQCRLGTAMLEGVLTMPEDQAGRIMGYLLTQA